MSSYFPIVLGAVRCMRQGHLEQWDETSGIHRTGPLTSIGAEAGHFVERGP